MADDLDAFLKQAAQRREQRQQQRGKREPNAEARPQVNVPPPPPRTLQQQDPIPSGKIAENDKPYQPTLGNFSANLPSESTANSVDRADERMQAHLKEAFQHEIGHLLPAETKSKKKKAGKNEQRLQETPATPAEVQPSAKVSSASLIAQLRDPRTLRMAIIAHEIMKRPWQ